MQRLRFYNFTYHISDSLVITITFIMVIRFVVEGIKLGRIFLVIQLIIWRFYTASETHVLIKIVQTLTLNLLTSIVNKIV